jgi:hypothetical protein
MHLGDPMTLLDLMFGKFERPSCKDDVASITGYTHDFLLFTEKLKALDEELDIAVSARISKILVQ